MTSNRRRKSREWLQFSEHNTPFGMRVRANDPLHSDFLRYAWMMYRTGKRAKLRFTCGGEQQWNILDTRLEILPGGRAVRTTSPYSRVYV